jgi:hypothetical protein
VVLWPEDQEGEFFQIRLSEPLNNRPFEPPVDLNVKLSEFAVKDKLGNPKYRKYKDREVALYDPPYEIGMVHKNRGEFSAWASVEKETLSQMINLVLSKHTTYVQITEQIKPKPPAAGRGKNRWVYRVSIHLGDEDERSMPTPSRKTK